MEKRLLSCLSAEVLGGAAKGEGCPKDNADGRSDDEGDRYGECNLSLGRPLGDQKRDGVQWTTPFLVPGCEPGGAGGTRREADG